MLTDPSGDQLGVLGPEIDDEDGVACGHVTSVVPGATGGPARWVVACGSCHDGVVRSLSRAIWLAVSAVVLAVGTAAPVVASVPPEPIEENVYLDLERGVNECISALPKPGCGREPVDAGDRGGWQQFLVFGVLMTAMAGIGTRIVFSVRKRARLADPHNSPTL